MFITKKHLSRRTILRGAGVSLALPLLDSMVAAQTPLSKTAAVPKSRFTGVLLPHGSAGSCPLGLEKAYFFPKTEGAGFETTECLASLEPFRNRLTVFSNLDNTAAMPHAPEEVGADHARSASCFLTGAPAKRTEGGDIHSGTSLDQMYAQKFGQDTPLPSIQLCIEDVGNLTGSCGHGYSCVYANTMSWSSPTMPLPMERDPRVVFERLFGGGANASERSARRLADRSILDAIKSEVASLQKGLDPSDRRKLTGYLEDVRELERRIQNVERTNTGSSSRDLPDAPAGVPDSFDQHAKLMYDLQWLAFMTETTRVSAFMMSRDASPRVYPESGFKGPFHASSHHGENPVRIAQYAKINAYHVKLLAYYLERLRSTPDGDGTLLDHTAVVYGSAMGNANQHDHLHAPTLVVGGASGKIKGGIHARAALHTPQSNAMLTVANRLGLNLDRFGDSTGEISI